MNLMRIIEIYFTFIILDTYHLIWKIIFGFSIMIMTSNLVCLLVLKVFTIPRIPKMSLYHVTAVSEGNKVFRVNQLNSESPILPFHSDMFHTLNLTRRWLETEPSKPAFHLTLYVPRTTKNASWQHDIYHQRINDKNINMT